MKTVLMVLGAVALLLFIYSCGSVLVGVGQGYRNECPTSQSC